MIRHQRRWNWVAVLLATLALAGCGGAQERAAEHLTRGKQFLQQKNYPKAKIEFKNVLQINPKSSVGYYYLGRVAEAQHHWRRAFGGYQRALSLDPKYLAARRRVARILLLAHQTDQAADEVKKILAQKPDDTEGLALKAGVLAQQGKQAAALALAEKVVAKSPKQTDAVALLAALYEKSGQLDKAISVLGRTAKLLPGDILIHQLLANAYVTTKQNGAAERVMTKLVAAHPDVFTLRKDLAGFYAHIGQSAKAEQTLRTAIKVNPDDAEPYLVLTDFLYTRYGVDKAAAELKSAIAAEPTLVKLRFGLAKLYARTGSLEKAATEYQSIIGEQHFDADGLKARDLLAQIRVHQGKIPAARKLIQDVLDESPGDNSALLLKGKLALASKHYSEAVSDFRTLLKSQPDSVDVLMLLAEANYANGATALAQNNLQRAAALHVVDTKNGVRLARLMFAMKEPSGAEQQIDAVLKAHPKSVVALVAKSDMQAAGKDYKGLETTLTRLQQAAPNNAVGFDRMGQLYRREHKNAAALKQFEQAYKLAPTSARVLSDLVSTELAMGRSSDAVRRVKGAIAAHPKVAPMRQLLGEVLASQHHYRAAASAFEEAITLQPKWWTPYDALAGARFAEGEHKAALSAYEQGLKVLPDNPQLVLGLAQMREKTGDIAGAISVYEQLLAKQPGNEIAANNLAALLADHRSNDAASLAKAKQLVAPFASSKQLAFLDTYGWVHYRLGDLSKAAKVLAEVVKKAPTVPVFQYHLGMVYYKQGNKAAAREHLRKALEGGSKASWAGEARRTLKHIG